MSKTTLYAISFILAVFILWTWFIFIPSLRRTTGAENKSLEAENVKLDSVLGQKQKVLDSVAKTSIYWETKFYAQLADSNVKIKYIGIKDHVSNLSGDSSVVYFNQRTGLR